MRIRKATDGRSNAPQRNGIAWQSAATEKLCKAEISNGKDKRRWAAQRNGIATICHDRHGKGNALTGADWSSKGRICEGKNSAKEKENRKNEEH